MMLAAGLQGESSHAGSYALSPCQRLPGASLPTCSTVMMSRSCPEATSPVFTSGVLLHVQGDPSS